MISTIADYTRLTRDMDKSLDQVATEPDVSRVTDYFFRRNRRRADDNIRFNR